MSPVAGLILKTITYRCIASMTTVAIGYATTGNFKLSCILGFCDFFGKMALYYLFELLWKRIKK